MARPLLATVKAAERSTHAASAVLSRDLRQSLPRVTHASGIYCHTESGRSIIDACGGSAVACLGHDHPRIKAAVRAQMETVSYCHSQFFTSPSSEDLASTVIDSTNHQMARMLTLSSGSEAVEAALKLARQYYLELPRPEPQRRYFIARSPSYHGATLTTLGLGGHTSRRAPFEPMLETVTAGKVSQCNPYRGQMPGESMEAYVARLKKELNEAFARFPEGSVCAFVAETVTGASTGTVPPAPGYLAAVKEVCERHGALLILDEVMCGMGRTGRMHAWQHENVVPNIQVIGKGFGGGYMPISGVLIDHHVNNVLANGSGKFSHGQSFQGHPVACAVALEVQKVIQDENLLVNVDEMGQYLSLLLRGRLGGHPHVGNIRGQGLFWSIEFVQNKVTREPFPSELNIGYSIHEMALQEPYNLCIYPGKGTIDGRSGDHVSLAPPYNVTSLEIDQIIKRLAQVVDDYFQRDRALLQSAGVRQW